MLYMMVNSDNPKSSKKFSLTFQYRKNDGTDLEDGICIDCFNLNGKFFGPDNESIRVDIDDEKVNSIMKYFGKIKKEV